MELISYMQTDQKNIRKLLKSFERLEDLDFKRRQFEELSDLINVFFRAEETAIYASSIVNSSNVLRSFALKGFNEHKRIDKMIGRVESAIEANEWTEQFNLFSQALSDYLLEEETYYFPLLLKIYESVELDRAAVDYLKLKKSEQARIKQNRKVKKEKEVQLGC